MTNDPTNDTADRETIVDALRDIRFTREQLHALAVALDEIMADWPGSSTTSPPTGP